MRDLDDSHPEELSIDAPGADEVAVVPWPLLLRERVVERMAGSPKYPWMVLAVALFGLFSVGFTITILSVSIPRIADELGSDTSTITWVVTGPLLAFAVLGPAMGKLGDIHGHRRIYGLSMACVCVFAALTAASWSAGALIAFRTLGAATGAAVGPGLDRHHQPAVPARAARAGDGLLVDGRGRRPGDRRGRRRTDRGDVRVALDLHRAGAAHARRAAARHARAAGDRAARAGGLRRQGRGGAGRSAPRRCCSPSTAGRSGAGRAR